jgi:hypothetical protein
MSEDDLLSLFDPKDHLAASAKIVNKVSGLVKETIRKFSLG